MTSVGSGPAVRGLIVQYTCLESYIANQNARTRLVHIASRDRSRINSGNRVDALAFSLLAVGSRITNRRCQLRKFLTAEET